MPGIKAPARLPRANEHGLRLPASTHAFRSHIRCAPSRAAQPGSARLGARRPPPRGFATIQEFDNRDRLVSRTEPESRSSTFTWDGADRQTLEQHNSGWRRSTEYNALGQPILVTDGEGKAISRVYDKRGNVLSQTDRRAAVVNWSYDARGRKETETGPVTGMQTVWTYDGTNNPVTETRANGQVLTHVYDAINRRTRSSDADGVIEDLEYDKANNLLQQTDANGRQTFYSYNDLNQRIQQTAPLGRISRMSPSVHGEVLTETMPTGGVTSHGYDALGRRTRTTFPQTPSDAAAPFATWNYDASGNVTSARDPRGLVTLSEFDGLNRRKKQTDPAPLSHQQLWTYDTAGNVLTHSDRNAVVTSYTYDTENRKKTTTRANSVRERLVYDGEGAVISRKDALERETVFELDKSGRVVETRLPENIVRKQRWSPLGDLLEVNDGTDRITKFTYDLRRRKITEANGANETMRYVYDAVGNLRFMAAPLFTGDLPTLITDCIGGAPSYLTRYCYDAAHRLIAVSDPQRHRTQYEYDLNDNLIAVIEPRGNRSEFRYDVRNRRIEKKSPELSTGPPQVWSWTYDPNGNPLTQTDPVGTVSTHTYDVLNRRTATVFASAPPGSPSARNWTYDPNGNPTAISETRDGTTVSLALTYDDFNRPTQLIDANARTWAQTWDAADQRKSLTSPDVPAVSWNYDNAGRAAQIIVEGAGTFTLGYDAADRNASINHPNGVQTTHSFDPAGRIAEIAHMRAGGTVARFQYQYDANGNRTTQIEENGGPAQTSTYTYDFADRLTAITEPGKHTTYTLDANSNRLETREGPAVGSVSKRLVSTFDARNQIRDQKEYNGSNALIATTNFEFDPNGNIKRQTKAALVTEYQYDSLDRLVAITPPTGPPASYRYGPSDVRIASIRGGEETRYHYDGERLVLETNTLGNPQKHYAYSAVGLLNSALLGASPSHRSAHLDAQTSPVVLSLANGNVLSRSHFDPYGIETTIFGVRDQAISYQGYWSAPEFGSTDLLSAGRFYLPGLGAFGERDPVEATAASPILFNPYLIGRSNPFYWVDPDGRESFSQITHLASLAARDITPQQRAADEFGLDLSKAIHRDFANNYVAKRHAIRTELLKDLPFQVFRSTNEFLGLADEHGGFQIDLGALPRNAVTALDGLVKLPQNVDAQLAKRAELRGIAISNRDAEALAKLDAGVDAAIVTTIVGVGASGAVTGLSRIPKSLGSPQVSAGPRFNTLDDEAGNAGGIDHPVIVSETAPPPSVDSFTPSDFGMTSIESNASWHRAYTEALKRVASAGSSNSYTRVLEMRSKGVPVSGAKLSEAFSTVSEAFKKIAGRIGLDVPEGPIHHWNATKSECPNHVFDPRILFATGSRLHYNSGHLNAGEGSDISY